MALRFETPSVHGVDRVVATAAGGGFHPSRGALTLTCLNAAGEAVDLDLYFTAGSLPYVLDLAHAINAVAEKHGRLTDAERRELLEEERAA